MKNVTENTTSKILWSATAGDARGQCTDFVLGNGLSTHKEFDQYGFPTRIATKNIATNINLQDLAYSFDVITGNLSQKSEQIGIGYYLTEQYGYDPILKSRLTSWIISNGNSSYTMQYKANGNIHTKSDVTLPSIIQSDDQGEGNDESNGTGIPAAGQYVYGNNAGVHAVTGINLPTPEYLASANNQVISYNGFNKVNRITQEEKSGITTRLIIEYGADNFRNKSMLIKIIEDTEIPVKTKYFFDDYEIETDEVTGTVRQLHYISAASGLFAIIEMQNNITTPYYVHTDYLGTYNLITNADGNKHERLSFDPWGRRRNPNTWNYDNVPTSFFFDRGYTGHEHLDQFGLINMNGRVFDPYLARFLSPDPILENNGNSQAFNRYSYCYNNPLKYTDPSGYKPQFDPCDPPPWNVWNPGFGPGVSTSSWRPSNDAIFFCSSQSAFINTYGSKAYNQLYFSNITLPSILSNSEFNLNLSGSKAEDFFAALQAGFSLSSVQAFGRTTYVLSLGDLGQMTLSNGGVKFSNPTSGEYLSGPNIIGGGFNFDNSNLALDIGSGVLGGLKTAVTPGVQWLGKNGKYYNNSWGGNRFTGSRSRAFAASNTYKWAGRAAVGVTAIIGGIAVYNGYQMDGGQFGYNANIAGASASGGIVGGWAGAQAGAYGFGITGGLIGGPPGAVVGAVIGGFVGGFWGSDIGINVGESFVNYYYGR